MRRKTTARKTDAEALRDAVKAARLPDGVRESDLKYPEGRGQVDGIDWEDREFQLWNTTGFGWCIPTLLISSGRRRGTTDRTYAVTLDGQTVRIGHGPHVTRTVRVYVRNSRLEDLQKYLDLRKQGAARSGEIRDRISTRRAKGSLFRAAGRYSWNWNEKI